MHEISADKGTVARTEGLIAIRDAYVKLATLLQQGANENAIKEARAKLNDAYDNFIKQYGYINTSANKKVIEADPDYYTILSLENYNAKKKHGEKADIFTVDTIAPNRTITSAKDVKEGVIISVNERGYVDAEYIAKLTGDTVENTERKLIDGRLAFKTENGLEAAETYLSGNVRAKLRYAENVVSMDVDYQNNIDELKRIIPEDIPYTDIYCNPGVTWIPASVYSTFASYVLGGRESAVNVNYVPQTGGFTVDLRDSWLKFGANNNQIWGTNERNFINLFDAMLNSRSVVVKKKSELGTTVIDKDATAAANEKIEKIRTEFQKWLWADENRRTELTKLYNETFNALVNPKYDGSGLTVNGMNALKPLREHQKNAVQRIIASGGNTLISHAVGAGKTYEMAAAAMKLKQLGLVNKPMFTVPKSLVAQWGKEFHDYFPTARLLVAEDGSFSPENRKVFINKIANGNYDAVILSYEQFEKIRMSDSFTAEFYQEQIDDIITSIEEQRRAGKQRDLSVKQLEKKESRCRINWTDLHQRLRMPTT